MNIVTQRPPNNEKDLRVIIERLDREQATEFFNALIYAKTVSVEEAVRTNGFVQKWIELFHLLKVMDYRLKGLTFLICKLNMNDVTRIAQSMAYVEHLVIQKCEIEPITPNKMARFLLENGNIPEIQFIKNSDELYKTIMDSLEFYGLKLSWSVERNQHYITLKALKLNMQPEVFI